MQLSEKLNSFSQILLELPGKLETFCQIFIAFLKSTLYLNYFESK